MPCKMLLVPLGYTSPPPQDDLFLLLDLHVCMLSRFSHVQLCDPMDCSSPGFPVHHLLEFAQTHVRRVGDAIQSAHLLLPSSHPVLNLSQPQGLFPLLILMVNYNSCSLLGLRGKSTSGSSPALEIQIIHS